MKWLPIADAPKDGTKIFGRQGDEIRICSWEVIDNPVAKRLGITGTWHRRIIRSGKDLLGPGFNPSHYIPYFDDGFEGQQ